MYTPVFCEAKLLFLSMESGGVVESDIMASVRCQKGLSDGEVKRLWTGALFLPPKKINICLSVRYI